MSGYNIASHRVLAEKIHEYWVEAPLIAQKHQAGQFVIVRGHEQGERIPLTVVQADLERGLIRLIVQEAGKTTTEWGDLKDGDSFLDVVGPLGKPTHIEKWGRLIAVAGGVGAAPLLPIMKAARQAGNQVFGILGARSKSLMILEDEFRDASDELRVCTDDGTYAMKGLVTDALRAWHDEGQQFDEAIIVGPILMMKFTALLTKELKIPSLASLNPIMVDGTGMCGACRVTVYNQTMFACVDGPEFDAHGVDFDELNMRNRTYLKQEKRAFDEWKDHRCRIGLTEGAAQHAK